MHIPFVIASLLIAGSAAAHPGDAGHVEPMVAAVALDPDIRPAVEVVDAFHAALQRGDTAAALSHLADEALIFESGGVERGKQEYAAHHLGADAAFAKAVPGTAGQRAGHVTGDIAWVATEGRTAGAFNGRAVDRVTAETMILRRQDNGWKIVHIHWSSAAGTK